MICTNKPILGRETKINFTELTQNSMSFIELEFI